MTESSERTLAEMVGEKLREREGDPTREPKPFVKWVGGKREQAERILAERPKGFDLYAEPMVGGGAVFFRLRAMGWLGPAVLCDSNANLMNAYRAVKEKPNELIRALKGHVNDKVHYGKVREKFNDGHGDSVARAAMLIYMNKVCFNGLYRVNKSGRFDSPFGAFDRPTICDEEVILAASRALDNTELRTAKFDELTVASLGGAKRPFIYFDPPYLPLSGKKSFTAYDEPFGEGSTRWLAVHARGLVRAGARVVLSSSDVPVARLLYEDHGFAIHRVKARRLVNSDATGRGEVSELIVTGG